MKTNKDAVVFTDAKGREWRPSLNVRVIKEFEQKSGLDFFGTVLDVIIDMQKRLNAREDMKLDAAMFKDITNFEMVQIFRKFFGNVGNLAFLLYEGCRRESTGIVVDAEGEEVAFEDFCQSIDEAHLPKTVIAAIGLAFSFFPALDEGEDGAGGNNPFGLGLGKMFTRSQESQRSTPGSTP